jgi:putative glutamine amidotransferase
MTLPFVRRLPSAPLKPLIGVLCCNEVAERPIQAVASRFVEPLSAISDATVLLVPALPDSLDLATLAARLDGLLLTGSRSNVAGIHYGGASDSARHDPRRDEVALALSGAMIERGRPVFGICRGLQELNVLFGGTLCKVPEHQRADGPFEALFEHEHEVMLAAGGLLAGSTGLQRLTVNSVHEEGIARLGTGLSIEAVAAQDELVEAFSASPCGAPILAVQWHPEWNAGARPESRAFFGLIGQALRGNAAARLRGPVSPAAPGGTHEGIPSG